MKTRVTSSTELLAGRSVPALRGARIKVRFAPALTASRGRLLSGDSRGTGVFAGAFLRRREIVLDTALRRTPRRLARIYVHELFHFVWARLGNGIRASYEDVIAAELARGARGELGWSAESRKVALDESDRRARSRRWREYICESFCDTAAWLYSGGRCAEATLARTHRERRRRWMLERLIPPLSI